jgi:hypothetical protein
MDSKAVSAANPNMIHPEITEEIKAVGLLDVIRKRPAMYLGEHSLTGLWHFLEGYSFAEQIRDSNAVRQLPKDFHEWVAYRLHYWYSTRGWRRMILEQVPDERAALERFYELLDEYRVRRPRVVATIQGHQREYTTRQQGQEEIHNLLPEMITLIAYTDDPGLFMSSEENADFPAKDRLVYPWSTKITREMMTVLDHDAFNRWLAEERNNFNNDGRRVLK